MARESLEQMRILFNLERKREIEQHCKKLTINSDDLASILLAAQTIGFPPYSYVCHHVEISPETLEPSAKELSALANAGLGVLSGDALKASRKIDQSFKDRKLLTIHLFHLPSHERWHIFYFDQRDYKKNGNHWVHGSHIHYSHSSFTREPLMEIWAKIRKPKPELPPCLHVRYDDQRGT